MPGSEHEYLRTQFTRRAAFTVLQSVRDFHALSDDGRCEVCLESLLGEAIRVDWPCDTAQLVYSRHEIATQLAEHLRLKQAAWEEHCDNIRRKMDDQRVFASQAYWEAVEAEAAFVRQRKQMAAMWEPVLRFHAKPILRFERFATPAEGKEE